MLFRSDINIPARRFKMISYISYTLYNYLFYKGVIVMSCDATSALQLLIVHGKTD